MKPTIAKATTRQYFYETFLPSQLSQELIQGGNYLLLLGAQCDELALLDRLGVPRYRIYSVERDLEVMQALAIQSAQRDMGVALYFGQLTDFVRHHLHTNQRFRVLNLDVCGSYLTNLDPVMAEILLFARRNPRTVVATYSSAGRDRSQLTEGLKSLAVFRRTLPEQTLRVCDALYRRYRAAGLNPSVCVNMLLRHLFWLRSHLERMLVGAVALGRIEVGKLAALLAAEERLWKKVVAELPRPISLHSFLTTVDRQSPALPAVVGCDVRLTWLQAVCHRAFNGFYHMGWFCTYEPIPSVTPRRWLEEALGALVAQPLLFAANDGEPARPVEGTEGLDPNLIIWKKGRFPTHFRCFQVPASIPNLELIQPRSEEAVNQLSQERGDSCPPGQASGGNVPLPSGVVEQIRQLARDNPAARAETIMALLPGSYNRKQVIAHMAVGRRKR